MSKKFFVKDFFFYFTQKSVFQKISLLSFPKNAPLGFERTNKIPFWEEEREMMQSSIASKRLTSLYTNVSIV